MTFLWKWIPSSLNCELLAARWLPNWFPTKWKSFKVLFFFFLELKKFHHQWHRVLSCLLGGQYLKNKAGLPNNHIYHSCTNLKKRGKKKKSFFLTVVWEIISISFWNMEFFRWTNKKPFLGPTKEQLSRQLFSIYHFHFLTSSDHPRENSFWGIFLIGPSTNQLIIYSSAMIGNWTSFLINYSNIVVWSKVSLWNNYDLI